MSWRLRVHHATGYRYDTEVVSSYNEARLTPHTDTRQLTLESCVETPPSVPQHRYWDYWGTQVTAFEVPEPHDSLAVVVRSVVETSAAEPVPADAPDWEQLRDPRTVDPALRVAGADDQDGGGRGDGRSGRCSRWLAVPGRRRAGGGRRRGGAGRLRARRHRRADVRAGGMAAASRRLPGHRPRDLGMLRSIGVPARYVFGYLHPVPEAGIGEQVTGESHAWVEVWLGGWWAYDPTNRVPAGERHVVVARGREYGDVPPLKGVYRGQGSHALGVQVDLTRLR